MMMVQLFFVDFFLFCCVLAMSKAVRDDVWSPEYSSKILRSDLASVPDLEIRLSTSYGLHSPIRHEDTFARFTEILITSINQTGDMFASAWDSFRANIAVPDRPSLTPLPASGTIRLIQLAPSNELEQGFRIVFRQFPLQEAPRFHVLSYTRGPHIYQPAVAEWEKTGCTHFPAPESRSSNVVEPVAESWTSSLTGRLASALSAVASDKRLVTLKDNIQVTSSVADFLELAYRKQRYRPLNSTPFDPDRKVDSKEQETYLWVDSICVNFKDASERARQVEQLGCIYKAAEKTIVWLGPDEPPEGVDKVIKEFLPNYLEDEDSAIHEIMWNIPDKGQKSWVSAAEPGLKLWEEEALHFVAFATRHEILYRHGWMQEILLSRNVELACGSLSWDWMVLERFVATSGPAARRFFNKFHARTKTLKKIGARYTGVIEEMEKYALIRKLWVNGTGETRRGEVAKWFGPLQTSQEEFFCLMLKMMRIMRGRRVWEDRDSVYGWLALGRLALPDGKRYASPSYIISARQVYIDFTKSLLRGMPVLDVLNDVGKTTWQASRVDLPSWVPDYSKPTAPVPLHARLRDNVDVDFDATLTWTRGNNKEGVVEFVSNCLVVSGLRLDIIHRKSPDFPANIVESDTAPVEWLLHKCAAMGTYGPTGQAALEALSFTLVTDSFVLDGGPLTYAEAFRGLWAFLLGRRMKSLTETANDRLLSILGEIASSTAGEAWIPASREAVELPEDWATDLVALRKVVADLVRKASRALPGRVAFVSREGYWGLGHQELQDGDEIWLLDGGRTPFVLRPGAMSTSSDYRLVGEAYEGRVCIRFAGKVACRATTVQYVLAPCHDASVPREPLTYCEGMIRLLLFSRLLDEQPDQRATWPDGDVGIGIPSPAFTARAKGRNEKDGYRCDGCDKMEEMKAGDDGDSKLTSSGETRESD
ncbi:hypothetical protein B0T10DRAFT_453869 [Thelonectria olida]|uniref:Heterokaryon incompatibility domain-containing protein n=1 Tax=Thelonectria olida TaxID=1576542 RepID=A0A9P8WGM9_9HYPO|nr:hypothetical protein B0T10DRAFT_453869 [Thelonectria olida]